MAATGSTSGSHASEVASGQRFEFGRNWLRFLALLDEPRIETAERSLREMLEVENLEGRRFLDLGCGSGLSSLAARRLGAVVHSFDYDPQSVICTRELRRRFFPDDPDWTVEEGSVLDASYLARLGCYDVVYSWGVLHHTGAMWDALGKVAPLVTAGGKLFIAIYNDQGNRSQRWRAVKRTYNWLPRGLRFLVLVPAMTSLRWRGIVKDLVLLRPFPSLRGYGNNRGMSLWRDTIDWVGGYPFEVAKPEEIFEFYRARGFVLSQLRTCRGDIGCNEFVFIRREGEGAERDGLRR
ncbi:MAG TPA: class I SAM-dependent methyltransferase [Myxococcota bacterium]|nr:class I SAM-dependent methyltransferase [Myxococcota bacterium]